MNLNALAIVMNLLLTGNLVNVFFLSDGIDYGIDVVWLYDQDSM